MKPINLLIISILLLCYVNCSGQSAPIDNVDVTTVSAATISTAIMPFDVPFTMTGTVPENCVAIDFYYQIDDKRAYKKGVVTNGLKNWICFKGIPQTMAAHKPSWVKTGADAKFKIYCPGIHPNLKYKFYFLVYRKVSMDDPSKKVLQNKLGIDIVAFFQNHMNAKIIQTDIDDLGVTINKTINKQLTILYPGQSLQQNTNYSQAYNFNVASDFIKPTFDALLSVTTKIYDDSIKTLTPGIGGQHSLRDQFITEFYNQKNKIVPEIDNLNSGTKVLAKPFKDNLTIVLTPGISDFKTYTVTDGLNILRRIYDNPNNMGYIIMGSLKIINGNLEASTARDLPSIEFLNALFQKLSEKSIIYTDDHKVQYDLMDPLKQSQILFSELANDLEDLALQKILLNTYVAKIPDVGLVVVAQESVSAEAATMADVSTSKSPYISAEGGLGYSTTFQRGLSYYAANIYFFPVNKNASLSSFGNLPYALRKMLCLNIGIANIFGDRPPNSYSYFGSTSSNDLLLGLGVRLNRFFKINFDWLPYRTSNYNTLTDMPGLRTDFVITAGIDVNILGGISSVAKGLKITN
jgi:hypothetical protein